MWLIFPIFLHAQEKEVMALIETNLGNMKIKLYNDTPIHRDNFIRLAVMVLLYRGVIRRYFKLQIE